MCSGCNGGHKCGSQSCRIRPGVMNVCIPLMLQAFLSQIPNMGEKTPPLLVCKSSTECGTRLRTMPFPIAAENKEQSLKD